MGRIEWGEIGLPKAGLWRVVNVGSWVAFLVRSHSDPMLSGLNRSVPVPTLTRLVFHLVSGRYTNEFVLLSQCIGLLFLD